MVVNCRNHSINTLALIHLLCFLVNCKKGNLFINELYFLWKALNLLRWLQVYQRNSRLCGNKGRRGYVIAECPVCRGGRTEPGPGGWEQCREWTAWAKPRVRRGVILIQPRLNHGRPKQYWQRRCKRVRTGLGTVANRWSGFRLLSHTETGQTWGISVTTVCLLEIIWGKDGAGVGEFEEAAI